MHTSRALEREEVILSASEVRLMNALYASVRLALPLASVCLLPLKVSRTVRQTARIPRFFGRAASCSPGQTYGASIPVNPCLSTSYGITVFAWFLARCRVIVKSDVQASRSLRYQGLAALPIVGTPCKGREPTSTQNLRSPLCSVPDSVPGRFTTLPRSCPKSLLGKVFASNGQRRDRTADTRIFSPVLRSYKAHTRQ